MKNHSILQALAERYEATKAGRTGNQTNFVSIKYSSLMAQAGCAEGDARAVAERILVDLERLGVVERVPVDHRDADNIRTIRFFPAREDALYAQLDRPSPGKLRADLAAQFRNAINFAVPDRWRPGWKTWCEQLARAAGAGESIGDFDRSPTKRNEEKLVLLPKLLAWEGELSLRFASCDLCGDSKTLERWAPELGRYLETITSGAVKSLEDIDIIPNPRSVLVHGPIQFEFNEGGIDFGLLRGGVRISRLDIASAKTITTISPRLLTIENETTFHEIARCASGTLLICTSYPGSATIELIRRLPSGLECWHFGDSDEAGFKILESLREKTERDFKPLHMQHGKTHFEQETMGPPTAKAFPFY